MLLRQGERAGVLEAEEQEMMDKVFDFSDTRSTTSWCRGPTSSPCPSR